MREKEGFKEKLSAFPLLSLHGEDILCDLLLVGFVQLQEAAAVLELGVSSVDDPQHLAEHGGNVPILQQFDLEEKFITLMIFKF